MTLSVNTVPAIDVLAIQELPAGRAGVWFLNWKIITLPLCERKKFDQTTFSGAGLYAISFDDKLIYIGSFLGSDKSGVNFLGDVVSTRWWAHIGAITSRGHRVNIARSSLKSLMVNLGVEHLMVKGFMDALDVEKLHKGDGDLSPLRRLQFAAQNSVDFFSSNTNPIQILSRFTFVYARFQSLPANSSPISLRMHIELAENALIQRYAPICNTKHVPRSKDPIEIELINIPDILHNALK